MSAEVADVNHMAEFEEVREMTGNLLAFSLVKKIGEGTYLDSDLFILERVRKERALNLPRIKTDHNNRKTKNPARNGRLNLS